MSSTQVWRGFNESLEGSNPSRIQCMRSIVVYRGCGVPLEGVDPLKDLWWPNGAYRDLWNLWGPTPACWDLWGPMGSLWGPMGTYLEGLP